MPLTIDPYKENAPWQEEAEMFPMAEEVLAEDLEDLMEEMQEVKQLLQAS